MNDKVKKAFDAFLEWERENIDKWIESERSVCAKDKGFAGTLDAVAVLKNGKKYVIDFKSSKGFYDGYDLQIAAYRYAYGKPVDSMGVLRLDKITGMPEWKEYKGYKRKLKAFFTLVEYYYLIKQRRLKNNPHVDRLKEEFS